MSKGQLLKNGASASSIVIVAVQLLELSQASTAVNTIGIPAPPLQSKLGKLTGKSFVICIVLQSNSSDAVAVLNQLTMI